MFQFLLCSDNLPTVILNSWFADAALFQDEQANGPVPLLFAADPELAGAAIEANPAKAHFDLNKIWGSFLAFEAVTTEEARDLIKKPRYLFESFSSVFSPLYL